MAAPDLASTIRALLNYGVAPAEVSASLVNAINQGLPATFGPGPASQFAVIVNGNAGVGVSDGLQINAGSNASDIAVDINSQSGTSLWEVRGDGTLIGGTPTTGATATGATFKAVIQTGNSFFAADGISPYIVCNAFYDGSNYRYNVAGSTPSMSYSQNANSGIGHQFFGAVGGTAGNVITFYEQFRINVSESNPVISARGVNATALVDMSPDVATAVATLTGCSTAPTGTAFLAKMGNIVAVVLPSLTGTSTSTGLTYSGCIPAEFQPTRAQNVAIAFAEDNTAATIAGVQVTPGSSSVTFFKAPSTSGASWTNGGTKGLPTTNAFVYSLS